MLSVIPRSRMTLCLCLAGGTFPLPCAAFPVFPVARPAGPQRHTFLSVESIPPGTQYPWSFRVPAPVEVRRDSPML
jgi:hypothetical protein